MMKNPASPQTPLRHATQRIRSALVLLSALLPATDVLAQSVPPQLTLDWPAIAAKLVERIAPAPGEKVLLLCHPGKFEELVPHLRYAVQKSGAVDLGCLDVLAEPVPSAWDAKVLGPRRAIRPTPLFRTSCAKREVRGARSTSTGKAPHRAPPRCLVSRFPLRT